MGGIISFAGLIALGLFVTACQTRRFESGTQSQGAKNDLVIVNCMTPQGNGGNWAATLGWIAEDYKLQGERAAFLEKSSSRKVYVYPRCFSGGSSGSGATNVVMKLLENDHVLKTVAPNSLEDNLRKAGFFTADEMIDYGRAMRFLALSADMSFTETLLFFKYMAHEAALANTDKNKILSWFGTTGRESIEKVLIKALPWQDDSEIQRVDHSADAKWWGAGVASAEGAVIDFGKLVHAAKFLKKTDVDKDISSVLRAEGSVNRANKVQEFLVSVTSAISVLQGDKTVRESLLEFAAENGIQTVVDFPLENSVGDLKCDSDQSCSLVQSARLKAAQQIAAALKKGGGKIALDDKTARFAQYYLIEALQAYYAGLRVDELASLDENGVVKGARVPRIGPQVYDLKTQFNADLSRARDGGDVADFRSSITGTLWEPMKTGYFTITSAAIHEGEPYPQKGVFKAQKNLKYFARAPEFSELRFVVLSGESTSKAIQASELYQQQISKCNQGASDTVCKFVIAQVNHLVYSLLPSVREPGLMNELYLPANVLGKVGSEHLGVTKLFDPKDPSKESQFVSSDETGKESYNELGARTYFAVGGGWPDRRLSSWMLMYYMDTLLGEHQEYGVRAQFERVTNGRSPDLIGVVSIFGKPDRVSQMSDLGSDKNVNDAVLGGKFDVNAVGSYFSGRKPSQKEAESGGTAAQEFAVRGKINRKIYLEMMQEYYGFFTGQRGRLDRPRADVSSNQTQSVPVLLQEAMNNWDLSEFPLPAFIPLGPDAGATRFLVKLSHNTIREGLIALAKDDSNQTGLSDAQLCPLSRFERKFESPLKIGPVNVLPVKPVGDHFIQRLECIRRLASNESIAALAGLGLPSYKDELQALAKNSKVTFNALDPRLNLGRKDSSLVVTGADGKAVSIRTDDDFQETPRPNSLQMEKLTGSGR